MRTISISLPEEEQDDPEVLGSVISTKQLLRILQEHGADFDEFERERTKDWRQPYTLGEVRDWLGY